MPKKVPPSLPTPVPVYTPEEMDVDINTIEFPDQFKTHGITTYTKRDEPGELNNTNVDNTHGSNVTNNVIENVKNYATSKNATNGNNYSDLQDKARSRKLSVPADRRTYKCCTSSGAVVEESVQGGLQVYQVQTEGDLKRPEHLRWWTSYEDVL